MLDRQGAVLGLCGLNRDPHAGEAGIGRLRHLYVQKPVRRQGIGSRLVEHVCTEASAAFHHLRLRTDMQAAADFYERRGFVALLDATASHVRVLRPAPITSPCSATRR